MMKLLAVFLIAVVVVAQAQLYNAPRTNFRTRGISRFRPRGFNTRFGRNSHFGRFGNRFDNDFFDFDQPDFNDFDRPDYDSSYRFNRNLGRFSRGSRFGFNNRRLY